MIIVVINYLPFIRIVMIKTKDAINEWRKILDPIVFEIIIDMLLSYHQKNDKLDEKNNYHIIIDLYCNPQQFSKTEIANKHSISIKTLDRYRLVYKEQFCKFLEIEREKASKLKNSRIKKTNDNIQNKK